MNSAMILVVGSGGSYQKIFSGLVAGGNFRLHFVPGLQGATGFLKRNEPGAILLALDPGETRAEDALEWLESVRDRVPVLVLSPLADMNFYVTVMSHGAFDFFTSSTPLAEIERELENAVTLRTHQAA